MRLTNSSGNYRAYINEPRARARDVYSSSTLMLSFVRGRVDGRALTWRGVPVHIDNL